MGPIAKSWFARLMGPLLRRGSWMSFYQSVMMKWYQFLFGVSLLLNMILNLWLFRKMKSLIFKTEEKTTKKQETHQF